MPLENIFWHKGLAYHSRSALQEAGFLKTAENIIFRVDGKQELRPKFDAINTTAVGAIHSIRRLLGVLFIADGLNTRWRSAGGNGDFTTLKRDGTNAIFDFAEYKDFLNCVNGTDNFLFDGHGNFYHGYVDNPATAPAGAVGAAGSPNDTYALYVSYLITWPNGRKYETGLSAASPDVTVTSEKIEWSSIPVCPYSSISGATPTIHRKLYRGPGTGGSLADIYLVTTLENNTATTYSDDFTDAALAANGASTVDNYDSAPSNPLYTAVNYGRFFYITSDNLNRLYYSDTVNGADATENEQLMPLSFTANNWDDVRVSGYGKCDPQGLITWGTYLYIPMKHTWIRKYGNDPDTWSYKKTWANIGIAAPHSLAKAANPIGILGISNPVGKTPGLSIFNGQTSQLITGEQLNYVFEDDLNHNYIHKCRGDWDGRYYHLLYPSGSNTEPDKWLALDLSRYPEVRPAFWTDLNAQSIDVYDQGDQTYIGGSDGYARKNDGTTTVNVNVETHDSVGGEVQASNIIKTLKELKYNINTGGKEVDLRVIIDGQEAVWPDDSSALKISGTGDKVQVKRGFPPNFEGYTFSFRVTGESLETLEIFSPWSVELDITQ